MPLTPIVISILAFSLPVSAIFAVMAAVPAVSSSMPVIATSSGLDTPIVSLFFDCIERMLLLHRLGRFDYWSHLMLEAWRGHS